jgi:hypothetical protein
MFLGANACVIVCLLCAHAISSDPAVCRRAQPRPAPCAAGSIAHGVIPTRWGARRIRTAPATRGARHGAAAASASFAAATTSATATADLVPARPKLASATYLRPPWLVHALIRLNKIIPGRFCFLRNNCILGQVSMK